MGLKELCQKGVRPALSLSKWANDQKAKRLYNYPPLAVDFL